MGTGKEMTVTNCGGKAKGEKRKMKGEKADLCDLKFFEKSNSPGDATKDITPSFKTKLKSAPILGRGFNKSTDVLEFTPDDDDFCYEKHTGEEPLSSNQDTFKIIHPKKTEDDNLQNDIPIKKSAVLNERSLHARNKAISILKASGPIKLEDPNIDIAKKN